MKLINAVGGAVAGTFATALLTRGITAWQPMGIAPSIGTLVGAAVATSAIGYVAQRRSSSDGARSFFQGMVIGPAAAASIIGAAALLAPKGSLDATNGDSIQPNEQVTLSAASVPNSAQLGIGANRPVIAIVISVNGETLRVRPVAWIDENRRLVQLAETTSVSVPAALVERRTPPVAIAGIGARRYRRPMTTGDISNMIASHNLRGV